MPFCLDLILDPILAGAAWDLGGPYKAARSRIRSHRHRVADCGSAPRGHSADARGPHGGPRGVRQREWSRCCFTSTPPATAALQPPSYNNGNGNKPFYGNGSPPAGARPCATVGIPAPPVKVGYDVALRRILCVAIAELKTAGEQWSDAARQDLVSTLIIQAARDGVITWLPLTREEGN